MADRHLLNGRGPSPKVLPRKTTRETVHLWFAIAITIVLSAYRITAETSDQLAQFFRSYTGIPLTGILTNLLFFGLLALLWIAYRRWRDSLSRGNELERVVSSVSPDVLMVVNPNRTIAMCNSAVKAMFGHEISDVIGKQTDFLYFDRRTGGRPREIYECLEKVGFHVGAATGKRNNGETFPLELVTGNMRGGPGAVVLIRDITERKRVEVQLLKAKEDAECANAAKTQALAQLEDNYARLKALEELRDQLTHMIVHDLKSPLLAIDGYLRLLKEAAAGKLDDSEREQLAESLKLTYHLNEMILSLLDVSRLEKREMPLNPQRSDLEVLARQSLDLVGREPDQPQIAIESPPAPVFAFCDADVIRRVFVNLLSNAVRFTPVSGSVCVRLEPLGPWARVSVIDTGVGVPREYHTRIFERFAQVEVRKFSTGLGLTFCKLAVEAHHGEIGIESEPGKGSRFWFTLPASPDGATRAAEG